MKETADLAIVGAGPAGLAAAIEARRLGVEVIVLDEYPKPGGQYFRQPLVNGASATEPSAQVAKGRALIEEARAAGAALASGALVWGVFPGPSLMLEQGGRGREIRARKVLFAPGAHDRTFAFPGWTLPGVVTPGAAQTLVKGHRVLPGRRVVVAGSGPFLLAVAAELARAGAEVAALVEAAHWDWGALAGLLRFPGRWRELAGYLATLRACRVPILLGHGVVRASGSERLEAVSVVPLERDGSPRPSAWHEIAADTLAIAQGFRANSELTGIAGCAHRFDELRGGRVCETKTESGETSVEGIYAAGEVTGLGGARVALEEGRIAGLSAARALGAWDAEADRRLARACMRRRREQAFADLVNRVFAPSAGLTRLIEDDTIVCRCEEVPARTIRAAVEAGARSALAVKLWTRCGMGPCQGRICGFTLNRYVAWLTVREPAEIGVNLPRIPVKPVPLSCILETGGGAIG